MKPFWKTRIFWILATAWLAATGAHYAGLVPAPYGLVVANLAAVAYAVARCLAKRQAGVPWRGILSTSELTVTSLTVVVNLSSSLAEVPGLPPKVLVGLSAFAGLATTVLHQLSGKFVSHVSDEELRHLVRRADGTPYDPADDVVTVPIKTDPPH